ncbi:hypothetical protein E5S70_17500 [Ensifer adhaerens]|uniref:hypothetical protein n=1 Tax=Ensifer canadensis TaxID=555315 RepID=UPI0014906E25|nr:hypothetical protein [Ensifer canadensis]NOV17849.1 hypothetical protein [Ensifer canadensis]
MAEMKHTPLPWKVVSQPNFDNGNVYTSIQPVNVDEEAMKPLAMMNGEFHVCRMSHTAASWRFDYHRANAAFIVKAVNAHDALLEACRCALGHLTGNMDGDMDLGDPVELLRAAVSKAGA